MNQRALLRRLRWTVWIASLVSVGYLFLRYDLQALPEEGCSPLLRFSPGNRLLLDRWPAGYEVGDALMFRGDDGRLYLGKVEERKGQGEFFDASDAYWVVTDNAECPGTDSSDLGWIGQERCVARVILTWPW